MPDPSESLLRRLRAVQERLAALSRTEPPSRLTDPDPPTGERWDWGQVWAHIAEFPGYWTGQIRSIMEADHAGPVPFGRVKSDPGRLAAIDAERATPAVELFVKLVNQVDELRTLMANMSDEDWRQEGVHQTLGPMRMPGIFEEFLVGHLEQHAEQLDRLAHDRPP
jgi:hypothetical protein